MSKFKPNKSKKGQAIQKSQPRKPKKGRTMQKSQPSQTNKGKTRQKLQPSKPKKSRGKTRQINPKTPSLKNDKVFKLFFKKNQKPLISLLQSFLPFPKPRKIKKVEILDSFEKGSKQKDKESIMDLRLRLDNNEVVNVEMQLHKHRSFTERMLFYGCKNYFSQLKEGQEYEQLHHSYSLVFCDFKLFKRDKKKFYRSCTFREDDFPHPPVSKHFRMIFVELAKFKEKMENLVDSKQAWCYLLNHLPEMGEEDRKRFASQNKDMEELMNLTKPLTIEDEYRLIAEAEEKQRRDRVAREDYVYDKGLEKGIEKGMEQVALNMLNEKVDLDLISKVTGFSPKELKKLKK